MKQHNAIENLTLRLHDLLHRYLVDEHPDLLIALQEDHRLQHYLDTKVASVAVLAESLQRESRPAYVIEALCMEELTADLRPSRFAYVSELLAEEFAADYLRLKNSGMLTYEVINLLGACEPVFLVFGFGDEAEEGRELRAAVTGMIAEYLQPPTQS